MVIFRSYYRIIIRPTDLQIGNNTSYIYTRKARKLICEILILQTVKEIQILVRWSDDDSVIGSKYNHFNLRLVY